ncbi:MAG TPA: hypothetical protein VGO13_12795 [Solirubrobacterales bacterium]|nr:hypothetical protein [Solirubrobacterales bacterium]
MPVFIKFLDEVGGAGATLPFGEEFGRATAGSQPGNIHRELRNVGRGKFAAEDDFLKIRCATRNVDVRLTDRRKGFERFLDKTSGI